MIAVALALVAGTPLTPQNFRDARGVSISCYLRSSLDHVVLPKNPKPTINGKLVRVYLPEKIVAKALRSKKGARIRRLDGAVALDSDAALGWTEIYRVEASAERPGFVIFPSPGPDWKNTFVVVFEQSVGWVALAKPEVRENGKSYVRETQDGPGQAGLGCSVTSGKASWAS